MGNLNKKVTVDPVTGNVGIGKTNPQAALDVEGGVKVGYTEGETEGVLRWNGTSKKYEFYNGTDWQELGSAGGLPIDVPMPLSTMPLLNSIPLIMTAIGPVIPDSMAAHTPPQIVPVHKTNEATPLTTMILED